MQPTQPMLPPEVLPPSPAQEVTQTDMAALSARQAAALGETQENVAITPPPTLTSSDVPPVKPGQVTGSPPTPPHGMPVRPAYPAQSGYYLQPQYGPPPRRRKRRRRSRPGCLSSGCLLTVGAALAVFVVLVLIVGLIVVSALSARLEDSLATLEERSSRPSFQTTTIYDRNGETLYEIFGEGRRTNVSLSDLPPYVAQAHIAVEDDSFYTNPGVDIFSIIRSAVLNTQQGGIVTGASTITQQVVRNIAFDYEYRTETSMQRKIEEALLAIILTNRLSKDEILELYLNEIYYGNLAYGIEAASQTIFGKSASDLTLGEAALLAGLPQAPAELDPLNPDPSVQEAVLARRRQVIELMLEEDYITQEQAYAAYGEPLSYTSPDVPLVAPHFTVYARNELESIVAMLGLPPDFITAGGLQVYTTLDLRYQDLAERTARTQVAGLREAHNLTNAAVVVLQPITGEVLAMVGSIDYWDDAIDGRVNVATAARQPGSTMKPFTYTAALEQGWSAAAIIWDTEVHFNVPGQETYIPVNYDSALHGPVRVRDALANSYNIPAVQTLRQVGVAYLLNLMQRFGVESLGQDASHYGLSLTLGGGEVTLLELTRAYSVFANGGVLVPSTTIRCVLDADENVIYQYENGCPFGQNTPSTVNAMAYGLAVLDPRIAFVISDILADNAARTPAMGSNSSLNTGDLVSSVKTGTTNDTRDNWTVGFTHNVAVGVWAGNSDNSPMVNTSGLTGAAPIWHDMLLNIYRDQDLLAVLAHDGQLIPDYLSPPPGMSRRQVCEISTLQDPASQCNATRVEWFLDGPALVPDANGNLAEGTQRLAQPLLTANPNGNGPQLTEPEAGIYQAWVMPLPADLAGSIVPTLNQPDTPPAPAPRYCLVPNEVLHQVAGAQALLFLEPPPDPSDAIYATQFAYARNIPILPPVACTAEMLTASPSSQISAGTSGVTAYISSPAPDQVVDSVIPIIGTVDLSSEWAVYYKFEIQGPQFPEWVTLGEVHDQSVVDGQLETLAAAGLQPGTYRLRLIVVGLDGNYLPNPYQVAFQVP